jgi:uncharacterized phiE125 gp8 family phage protein
MRLSLVDDAGAVEPVTLDDVKLQVKLPVGVAHPEDSLLEDILIPAARARGEGATNRQFRQATWDLALDSVDDWPCARGWIEIPKSPLVEVLSVTYVDTDGVTQIFAVDQYLVDAPTGPKPRRGRVALAYGATWPWVRDQIAALTIRFVAGYSPLPLATYGPPLPALLKAAMLLDIATLYGPARENVAVGTIVAEIPGTANAIYRSFKSHPTQRVVAA